MQSPSAALSEQLTEPFFFSAVYNRFFLSKNAKDTFTCIGKLDIGDLVRTDVAPAMTFAVLDGEF